MIKKTAVILMNLGGPDKPESIRPFLINFFMDKNIIRAPYLVRYCISRIIANKRSKKEAGTAYGQLGGKSPLLENTMAQAGALQAELGSDYRVFVTMRYWHPMSDEIVPLVKNYEPDQIVLLPLYPQYSTTTTKSSIEDWRRAARQYNLEVPTSLVCCYPFDEGFIQASVDRIKPVYEGLMRQSGRPPRLLFSAHGLPEKIIKSGDPYQWQCEETARKIAEALQIYNLDWTVCYQSRVGPLKWIGPSTEDALQKAAQDKTPVLIYPHAFVSEHVETLVEIEEEYRDSAKKLGVPGFARVETVGTSETFIKGLAQQVRTQTWNVAQNLAGQSKFPNNRNHRFCPMQYSKCCHNKKKCLGIF
ncbi:MAG: ferrochelatase [Alphaproteobacteria bacterium]|jgi:ferrochelatase|nr:ferrochelatase [Alphaproteobacteria bacterium]MCB1551634.1 ferrochelatase [Alphaproteobacteria bacterium]MCB9985819.1 ferrochelatase [Micavibrio sp.]HPQ50691.1 ferrochelatase [Alphaproteobacteria bacterium]